MIANPPGLLEHNRSCREVILLCGDGTRGTRVVNDRLEGDRRPKDVRPQPHVEECSPSDVVNQLKGVNSAVELPIAAALRELGTFADPNRLVGVRKRALESFSEYVRANPALINQDFSNLKLGLKTALTPQGEVEEYRAIAAELALVLAASPKGRALLFQIVADPTELISQSSIMSVSPEDPLRLLTTSEDLMKKIEVMTAILPALASPGFKGSEVSRLADQLENGDRELCHSLCRVLPEVPSAMCENTKDQKEELRRSILNSLLGTEDISERELALAVSFLAPTLTEYDVDQICFDFERGSMVATELLLSLYSRAENLRGEFDDSLKRVMHSGKTTAEQLAMIQGHSEFTLAASPEFTGWLVRNVERAGEQLGYGANPIKNLWRYFKRSVLERDFAEQKEVQVTSTLKTLYLITKANPTRQKAPEGSLRRLAGSISPSVAGWASLLLGDDSSEFHKFLSDASRATGNRYPEDLREAARAIEQQYVTNRQDRYGRR